VRTCPNNLSVCQPWLSVFKKDYESILWSNLAGNPALPGLALGSARRRQPTERGFHTVDGIKYAHSLKFKISAGEEKLEFAIKVKEVKHNLAIEDAKFSQPTS